MELGIERLGATAILKPTPSCRIDESKAMRSLNELIDPGRVLLFSIFLVAFWRGVMYAGLLPPWGLIDEEQHIHYIQMVTQGEIPIVGKSYLSPEIVNSLFETGRWATFHWPSPPSHDPRQWGLEGNSYEGYQPPLFYFVCMPLYLFLPSDMLVKAYGLRFAMVGLSLLTVWIAYRTVCELLPAQSLLPQLVCLLLVVIPERTASVSQVNNDVLLEVVAAGFIWVCTRAILHGLTVRRSQVLGLFLGLGLLTKMTMAGLALALPLVFWVNRGSSDARKHAFWTGGIASILALVVLVRNYWLYGDPTGFSSFSSVAGSNYPTLNPINLLSTGVDVFRNFWVVWWNDSPAADGPLVLTLFYLGLTIISVLSITGLGSIRKGSPSWISDRQMWVIIVYLWIIASYAVIVLASYFGGSIPVVQGRFFLPAIVPIVTLIGVGLWFRRWGMLLLIGTAIMLVVMDALSLFGNLLPYFYYWSAFFENGIPKVFIPLNWPDAASMFYARFLSDKPVDLRPVLSWMPLIYLVSLALLSRVVVIATRELGEAGRRS